MLPPAARGRLGAGRFLAVLFLRNVAGVAEEFGQGGHVLFLRAQVQVHDSRRRYVLGRRFAFGIACNVDLGIAQVVAGRFAHVIADGIEPEIAPEVAVDAGELLGEIAVGRCQRLAEQLVLQGELLVDCSMFAE